MILIEIVDWIWNHPGEVTLNAVLLFFLRKFVIHEMHKLFHMGREGEVKWLIEKVEVLIGEKYDGQPAFLKTVGTRYFGSYYFYLRKVIPHVYQKRRVIKMNQQNINYVTLIGALLGAAKLVLQAFGVEIPSAQVNEITNGAAALASIIGVILTHRKGEVTSKITEIKGDSGQAV